MRAVDFIQENDLFLFDRIRCLRNEYYHNQCKECIDICPVNAIDIVKNKISLDEKECTGCGVCVGVCPSEALVSKNFDPEEFALTFRNKDEDEISCKKNSPCLSFFDTHHYIYMALKKDKDIFVDLKECEGCSLNMEGKTLESIKKRVDLANSFLKAIESGKEIKIQKEEKKLSRRELFGKFFKEIKNFEFKKEDFEKEHKPEVPKKLTLLKSALKEFLQNSQKSVFEGRFPFIVKKEINDSCTNCGECVQFCPTGALFYSSDASKIFFQSGKCINCDICDDICKERAIRSSDLKEFDLINFAFDRAEILIEFTLEVCRVCKCAFAYKGGDKICPRCEKFENDFSDIFKLASQEDGS